LVFDSEKPQLPPYQVNQIDDKLIVSLGNIPESSERQIYKMQKFTGEIKSMDAMAKSIVVTQGKVEKSFVVAADTKITNGKQALKFEDLKAGLHIHIEYVKEMDNNVAATIKTYPQKAHPKEK
jgi:hypothetical protein